MMPEPEATGAREAGTMPSRMPDATGAFDRGTASSPPPGAAIRQGHAPRPPLSPEAVRERLRRLLWDETAERGGWGVPTKWFRRRFHAQDRATMRQVLAEMEDAGEVTSERVKPRGQEGTRWHPGPNATPPSPT
jgi:hypothetical protein